MYIVDDSFSKVMVIYMYTINHTFINVPAAIVELRAN